MIKIEKLTRLFAEGKGVEDINLEITKGGIYALLGENSSGKTTLINLLTGMILPKKGSIKIKGVNKREDYMKVISYFKDDIELPLSLTVTDLRNLYNTYFEDFDIEYFNKLIIKFSIDESQIFGIQSKGNKALTRIALTLSRNTPYYILDEPLSGVDAVKKELIMQEILSIIDETKILIISSHNLHDIDKSIDEIILLDDTKLVEVLTIDDILSQEYNDLNEWFINKKKS